MSIDITNEPRHDNLNNVVCVTSKASDQPAHRRSLKEAFASRLNKLLTKEYLEILSLKSGCTGSYETTLVEMTHCWKSHVVAQILAACIDTTNLRTSQYVN